MRLTERNSQVELDVKLQSGISINATFQVSLDLFWLLNNPRSGCLNAMQTLQLMGAVDNVFVQSTYIQDKVEVRSSLVMIS